MSRVRPNSDARERVLKTAADLFYQEGFRAVGIDRIIAEAGVAKMSLYNHFRSKDDLILAVLEYREALFRTEFSAAIAHYEATLNDPLRAFFAVLKDRFESGHFRGCVFMNASLELADPAHPASVYVQSQKRRFMEFLTELLVRSLGDKAAAHAPAIGLLVEGAIVTAVIQGSSQPADVALEAALKLVGRRQGRVVR
jgi:AcrR family transcriptional regulator